MAQTEVGHRHREDAEDKHQGAVRERQILGKELCAGTGQANRRHQTRQENQRRQQHAARTTEGMLNVSVQDSCTVGVLIDQHGAVGTQAEQCQIQQRQTHTGHQASPDGIASQQARFSHAAGTRGIDDNDTKHHRAQRIHRQIAVHKAVGERRIFIGVHRVADRACRPDDSGYRQHDQGHNFQRRQEVTHGIQQFARVEGNQNHNREVDQAVDKQRHRAVTRQRSNPYFKGNGRRTRGRKQRTNGQIADGRQQNASHFANRGAEAVHAATDFRQRDNGENR